MFGLNNAQLIGRLGADATISHLTNGGRVANISIATDESFLDKNSGDKVDRTEWHRIVTFQDGLVEMMEKHARRAAWSMCRASCRPASGARTARTATGSRPRSSWSPAAESSSWISRTETAHRRRAATPCLPPRPPRRWMTAKFLSSGLSPSRITQGQSPPSWHGTGPSFLPAHQCPAPQTLPYGQPGVMRLRAPRFRPKPPSGRGGPEGASRNRHERFPMKPFHAIAPQRKRAHERH